MKAQHFAWPTTTIGMTYKEIFDALYWPNGDLRFGCSFQAGKARNELRFMSDLEWNEWKEYKSSRLGR